MQYNGSSWVCGPVTGTTGSNLLTRSSIPNCTSSQTLVMTVGPTYTLSCANISIPATSISSPIPTNQGGTGATNANTGFNNLAPSQATHGGKFLTTDGTNTSWATVNSAIAADSLNFTEFSDAMTLDASTDIAATGTNVLSITNSGTGHSFIVNDQASDTSPFVIDAAGNVGVGVTSPTSALDINGVLTIRPLGTGAGQAGQFILRELAANGIEIVTIRAPDAIPTNYSLTLPADPGGAGQVLQTNGTGVLSWATVLTNGSMILLPNGSNTAPSLGFSGDTDTGMFSPAADNIAFTTGGLERMRIDPNGNLGIGKPNPNTPIDAVKLGSSGNSIDIVARFNNDSLNTITAGFGASIQLAAKTSSVPGQPLASIESSWTNPTDASRTSILRFSTVNSGSMAPKMVITGPGNVGIGTTTPQATLDINGIMKLAPQGSMPVACSGNPGLIAYNSTINKVCYCGGGANWVAMDETTCTGW
ncbi:hypothetical protein K2X05_13040 [bacterium]|nr:hypothetical protein [bacterium]